MNKSLSTDIFSIFMLKSKINLRFLLEVFDEQLFEAESSAVTDTSDILQGHPQFLLAGSVKVTRELFNF